MLEARITDRLNESDNMVKAYAELTVDSCAVIRGLRLMEGEKGMFVSFPSERAYDKDTKAPKVDEEGRPVYHDIVFPITKEAREAVLAAVLEAYNNEEGIARHMEAAKGQHINAEMYEAHGENVKAVGSVTVGDFACRNIMVSLRDSEQTKKKYAMVTYPSYKTETKDGIKYIPYLEFKKDGDMWDKSRKMASRRNFDSLSYGIIVKAAKEASPVLNEALEKKDLEKKESKEAAQTDIPLQAGKSGKQR